MKLGATDFLSKPFDVEDLKSILDDIELDFQKYDLEKKENIGKNRLPKDAYEYYKKQLGDEKGLCITVRDPDSIKEKYRIQEETILRFIHDLKDEGCLDPKDLYGLKQHIEYYFRDNPNGVVLFDGLGILIKVHSWGVIRKFIQRTMVSFMNKPSRLIMSVRSDEVEPHILGELKTMLTTPSIQNLSESLSGPIRRNIIRHVSFNGGSTFTDIHNELKIDDPPKLSFHLKKLVNDDILQKDGNRSYSLTQFGWKAFDILESLEEEVINKSNNGVKLVMNRVAM
jgi:DNA-binding HxlR family transcriptional regulator